MKERPILFSGPMIRAILDGRKTMTRRVMDTSRMINKPEDILRGPYGRILLLACPYGRVGDFLWVRETFFCDTDHDRGRCIYRADEISDAIAEPHCWKPSIFMPRWASRITLEITDVRVERLQDIHATDVQAEGLDVVGSLPVFLPKKLARAQLESLCDGIAKCLFRDLWDSLNAKRGHGWDTNPWVWVISFKQHKEDR